MWKQFATLALRLWSLTEDTTRNKAEIKELRQQLDALALEVRDLAYELRHVAEHEAHEWEKWVLKLENELLRFERRLPASKLKSLPNSG
jgi:hypothetical protein